MFNLENNFFDPDHQKCVHDQEQAEACEDQASKDLAERLKIDTTEHKPSSSALDKAKGNSASLAKERKKHPITPLTKDDRFIKKLTPLGEAFKGGSHNLPGFGKQ